MNDSLLPTAPALDEPLEILEACHGRIEAQLKTLERLRDHLPVHGADQQAQQAARGILRYFDTAAQHHHEDEEVDLFPLLALRAEGPDRDLVSNLVDGLLADHGRMFSALSAVREQLLPIAEGRASALDALAVQRLTSCYRDHIEKENSELLAISRRLLSHQDIVVLSEAMTARRSSKS